MSSMCFMTLSFLMNGVPGMEKGPDGEAWHHPDNMGAFSGRVVCFPSIQGQ